ncbi:MAG: cytochrome P450, partial [Pseudomonadota bacterium]
AAGEFDAVEMLGAAFPLSVFPDAMGIGKNGRENLLLYSDMIFNAFGPRNEIFQESTARAGPVVDWLLAQCSREGLASEGWGAEVYALADEAGLNEEAAGFIVRALLTAGLDTTVNAIGSSIVAFARHPAEWDKLVADPKRAARIIDEIIRWRTPIQHFFRTTSQATQLGGVDLPKDAKIILTYGGANHDPRQWDAPERFDLDRRVVDHLGLGHGTHRCVGQMVARLEIELLFTALANRVARFELTAEPAEAINNTLMGYKSVPVRAIAL